MNVTNEQTAEPLDVIQQASRKTRRAISAHFSSDLLMVWGAVWIAGFLGTHFWVELAGWIWIGLCAFCVLASFVVGL